MPRDPGRLTERELDALRLAANGLTSQQIGAHLGVSSEAIHLRLKAAGRSLGSTNRTHTVALAIAAGFIRPDEIHPAKPLSARLSPATDRGAPGPRIHPQRPRDGHTVPQEAAR